VLCVHRDDCSLKQLGWAIAAADKDVGMAAVTKSFQNMGGREQITLFVNEEAVAKEAVAVPARGRGWVQLIHDGADCACERGAVCRLAGRSREPQGAHEAAKESSNPGRVTAVFLRHLSQEPFFQISEPAAKKLAVGGEAGKSKKRTGKKELDREWKQLYIL
jgi:hypothetical protein